MLFRWLFFSLSLLGGIVNNYSGKFDYVSVANKREKRIEIPSIKVNMRIFTDQDYNENVALLRGAFKLPNSGDPLLGGNMVVVGHRLRAGAPLNKSFYNLPKLHKGDEIIVNWLDIDYKYIVDTVTIVEATYKIEVLTNANTLTLVTCTPLESSTHRLIITATKDEN